MKALITGGLGFIGSHLTEKLLDLGYEVEVIDLSGVRIAILAVLLEKIVLFIIFV